MSQVQQLKQSWKDQGLQAYMVVCLCSVMVILLILFQKGAGLWSFLPVVVGMIVILTRWSAGPVLMLLALAAVLNVPSVTWWTRPWENGGELRLADFVLCASALGFVTAHYRLRSLVVRIFPADPRRLRKKVRLKPGVIQQPRAARLVSRREIGLLVLTLPGWAVLGLIGWLLLPVEWANPGLPERVWRLTWLAWLLGVGFLVGAGIIDYWQRRQMTTPEAALYLQDVFWQPTRGEQRRLNRWLAWTRVRLGRRKEKR